MAVLRGQMFWGRSEHDDGRGERPYIYCLTMREFNNNYETAQLRLGLEPRQNSDLGLEPTVF